MDYEITVDDPKVFTRPFTIARERLLSPDTQLLEDVCENERSHAHMSGDTGVRLRPDQVAPLAGVYEIAPGREFTITVTEDLVFVRGLNEPKGAAVGAVGNEVHVHDDADRARVLQGLTRYGHTRRRARRGGGRTEGGAQERRRAGQMRRVIPVSALLLIAAATLSAQTGAWLGQPMTAWNQPAGAVPASGIEPSSQAALERRCGSASTATAVSSDALRREQLGDVSSSRPVV